MRFHVHGLVVFMTVHALVAALSALGYIAFGAEGLGRFLYWWGVCLVLPVLLFVSLVAHYLLMPLVRRWAGMPAAVARPPVVDATAGFDSGFAPHEASFDGSPMRNGRDMYMDLRGTRDPLD